MNVCVLVYLFLYRPMTLSMEMCFVYMPFVHVYIFVY